MLAGTNIGYQVSKEVKMEFMEIMERERKAYGRGIPLEYQGDLLAVKRIWERHTWLDEGRRKKFLEVGEKLLHAAYNDVPSYFQRYKEEDLDIYNQDRAELIIKVTKEELQAPAKPFMAVKRRIKRGEIYRFPDPEKRPVWWEAYPLERVARQVDIPIEAWKIITGLRERGLEPDTWRVAKPKKRPEVKAPAVGRPEAGTSVGDVAGTILITPLLLLGILIDPLLLGNVGRYWIRFCKWK